LNILSGKYNLFYELSNGVDEKMGGSILYKSLNRPEDVCGLLSASKFQYT
jgi:hypothetical protein